MPVRKCIYASPYIRGCREIDSPMNRGDDAYVSSPPLKINEKKKKDG